MLCQETLALQKSLDHFVFDLLSMPERYQNRNKIKPRKGNIDYTFFQGKHQYMAKLSIQSNQEIDKKFQKMGLKDNDEKSEYYEC